MNKLKWKGPADVSGSWENTNWRLRKLKIKYLTVGYDFKFGKNRQGDVDLLQKMSLFFLL